MDRTIALVLAKKAADSQVIIDGLEVTDMCCGVEVRAMVGEATRVTLHLTGRVEVLAEIEGGQLSIWKLPGEQT